MTKKKTGRKKGTLNRSTKLARDAVARFVDNNTQNFQIWIEQIAADNPKDAFDCVTKLLEYHIPKLARTETTHKGNVTLGTQEEFINQMDDV